MRNLWIEAAAMAGWWLAFTILVVASAVGLICFGGSLIAFASKPELHLLGIAGGSLFGVFIAGLLIFRISIHVLGYRP